MGDRGYQSYENLTIPQALLYAVAVLLVAFLVAWIRERQQLRDEEREKGSSLKKEFKSYKRWLLFMTFVVSGGIGINLDPTAGWRSILWVIVVFIALTPVRRRLEKYMMAFREAQKRATGR